MRLVSGGAVDNALSRVVSSILCHLMHIDTHRQASQRLLRNSGEL